VYLNTSYGLFILPTGKNENMAKLSNFRKFTTDVEQTDIDNFDLAVAQ
jgi:hypothetical protein